MTAADHPMVEVKNLVKHFPVKGNSKAVVHAVDDVSFDIPRGKTLGLVGESGCGKSTVARTVLRVHEPTSGSVWIDGENITAKSRKEMRPVRRKIQMIFQDPYASLNSRMTVRDIVAEPLKAHKIGTTSQRDDMVEQMLRRVGLLPSHMTRYPHEFSGGQRQRIGIARALILEPQAIVCDEPISALDASVQAQVVNLLRSIQLERGLSYLFIAHDLSMVRFVSDEIIVMYLGQAAEQADADDLYRQPLHPYTRALLASAPGQRRLDDAGPAPVDGDLPSPINPPTGCRFRTRCAFAMPICAQVNPELTEVLPGHKVACHLYPEPLDPREVPASAVSDDFLHQQRMKTKH